MCLQGDYLVAEVEQEDLLWMCLQGYYLVAGVEQEDHLSVCLRGDYLVAEVEQSKVFSSLSFFTEKVNLQLPPQSVQPASWLKSRD